MISKLLLLTLTCVNAFFNPSVKLSNGKSAILQGNGPPVLFSTGIFGTVPQQFYNQFIKSLKHNVTVVTIDGLLPIAPSDINDLADSLKVDSLAYVGHSSFEPTLLETNRINNAVLIDPIVIPEINMNTIFTNGIDNIDPRSVSVSYPVIIIKSEKLYKSKLNLPTWQELTINGNVKSEIYNGVGHPDILDDTWANIAKSTNLWGTAQGEIVNFRQWKYDNTNTIPSIRKEYRDYVADKIITLINNNKKEELVINNKNLSHINNEFPIN